MMKLGKDCLLQVQVQLCVQMCVCACEYFTGLSKHLLSISICFEMLLSWIR